MPYQVSALILPVAQVAPPPWLAGLCCGSAGLLYLGAACFSAAVHLAHSVGETLCFHWLSVLAVLAVWYVDRVAKQQALCWSVQVDYMACALLGSLSLGFLVW